MLALGVGVACGGSSFTTAPTTGDGGGVEGGVGGGDGTAMDGASTAEGGPAEAGTSGDAGPGGDGGGGTTDGASDAVATQDAADAPTMPCPDVRGTYALVITTGSLGCGDLNATAPQCIRQPVGSCTIDFISNVSGGAPAGINGSAMLQNDGVFDSASLTEGTVDRSGCTGSWDRTTSTMTVNCGGTSSTQSCAVKLVRSGPVGASCN